MQESTTSSIMSTSNLDVSRTSHPSSSRFSPSEGRPPLVRSSSNAACLPSQCSDLNAVSRFEVLYIGKIRMADRRVPNTLIDDALIKFKQHEFDKKSAAQLRRNSLMLSQTSSMCSEVGSEDSILQAVNPPKNMNVPSDHSQNPTVSESVQQPNIPTVNTMSDLTKVENGPQHKSGSIDREFDNFTKERVELSSNTVLSTVKTKRVQIKPLVLESNILSNVPVQTLHSPLKTSNLTTVNEDDGENTQKNADIGINVSDAASSITLFCQDNLKRDLAPSKITKDEVKNEKSSIRRENFEKEVSPANSENGDVSEKKEKGFKDEMPENRRFLRDRAASIAGLQTPFLPSAGEQNRTMLFLVGKTEILLKSPHIADKDKFLLQRPLHEVAACARGIQNTQHFGVVCLEKQTEAKEYVGYVFRCASESVCNDLYNTVRQALDSAAVRQRERSTGAATCDHCPMEWYHQLCLAVDGLPPKRIASAIQSKISDLGFEEQDQIRTKYQGGLPDSCDENTLNEFYMLLLKAHCEAKQLRHIHDTKEIRSEFLQQVLGSTTIFSGMGKLKRTVSQGLDILKGGRRGSSDHIVVNASSKEHSPKSQSPSGVQEFKIPDSALLTPDNHNHGSSINSGSRSPSRSQERGVNPETTSITLDGYLPKEPSPSSQNNPQTMEKKKLPMMDIFMKLGPSSANAETSTGPESSKDVSAGTVRHTIFDSVGYPVARDIMDDDESVAEYSEEVGKVRKRTRGELRMLWRKAISQELILVRMDKENARLKARQEVSAVNRIKLEYEDVGCATNETCKVWDSLLAKESRITGKIDYQRLRQAVKQGIPRTRRGQVWYFLAEQHCMKTAPPDIKDFPHYNTPYESILALLTSDQHSHTILIDLGRTFPNHPYFCRALGPGQLSLFNLLKAYSILDPQVGYCQGLSFVAAVLLLHMEESEAFLMLRHLMFRRGLRRQYLPHMAALQVQLYQLSRLIFDNLPEVWAHLDKLDAAPALYATPWMLTVFTSDFPLGFVARVFDLLFLDSYEVIFRVSLALLQKQATGILMCPTLEEVKEYIKHKLPNKDKEVLDSVIKQVFKLDISKQLREYEVEYSVLLDEGPRMAELERHEAHNTKLRAENEQLMERLEEAVSTIANYQSTQARLENQVRTLENSMSLLARYIVSHHDRKRDQDVPSEIRRICQTYQNNKKVGFTTKLTSNLSKFDPDATEIDEKERNELKNNTKKSSLLQKTGISTPNLFAKMSKEETLKIADNNNKISPEKRMLMKKSMSVNSGLVANQIQQDLKATADLYRNLKPFPLRVLDESSEDSQSIYSVESSKTEPTKEFNGNGIKSSFFAKSHEQIEKERMFARQQKKDFDENLRRLNAKLLPNRSYQPQNYIENEEISAKAFQSQPKSLSLNLQSRNIMKKPIDSGFVSPITPIDKNFDSSKVINEKLDLESLNFDVKSIISEMSTSTFHPLCDCDVDIQIHSSELKKL